MKAEYVDMGVPANIRVSENFQRLRIVRSWFHFKFLLFTLFVMVWDSFLLFWYWTAFSRQSLDLMMLIFPLVHVSLGVGLTYYTVAGYLNKTTMNVDSNMLSVRHGPIPFWGNKTLSSKSIVQLCCKRDQGQYRTMFPTFEVRAITDNRKNIQLLSGLDNTEQALFIEQEIKSSCILRTGR